MSKPVLKIRQSELSGWMNCRRKNVLQYAEGWTRPSRDRLLFPPNTADTGNLVHAGLEVYYRDGIPPHVFIGNQGQELAATIEGGLSKAWADTYNLAFLMTKGYIEWVEETGIDAGLVITGVERELEVYWGEVDGYDVFITGHIDLEGIDALGRPILIDHKSVATLTEPAGPTDFQRATYAMLRRMEDGTQYAALYHNQLRRVKRSAAAKPPFYARTEITFNDDQMRKQWQTVNVLVHEIVGARKRLDAGEIKVNDPMLYARPSRDCSWSCPFFNACPMMDDGSDWEWYLGSQFEQTGAHVPGREEEE